jgi:hypothetical protein
MGGGQSLCPSRCLFIICGPIIGLFTSSLTHDQGRPALSAPNKTRASIFEFLAYVQIVDLDRFDLDILTHRKPCAFVYSQGQFPTQLSLHVGLPEVRMGQESGSRRQG